jgi:hypothetical protein
MRLMARLIVMLSHVVWIALRRVETRLRAQWVWRHGRERAVMRGVIHC